MVLQSELVDDDLEHFEDIVEETDNEPSTASKKTENKNNFVDSFDSAKPDIDSSQDVDDSPDVSPSPSSDDELSDEAEELIVEYGSKGVSESKKMPNHDSHQQKCPIMKSLLPGGYNPRHREPSYWYHYFEFFFVNGHVCVFWLVFFTAIILQILDCTCFWLSVLSTVSFITLLLLSLSLHFLKI